MSFSIIFVYNKEQQFTDTMKKHLLLFVFTLGFIGITMAQTLPFSLSWNGEPIPDGSAVYILGDNTPTNILKAHAIVTNNKAEMALIKVVRTEKSLVPETWNYFCYAGTCYSPSTNESNFDVYAPGESSASDDFYADYQSNGHSGTSIIEYAFVNHNNPEEKVSFTVYYTTSPASVEDLIARSSFSNPYPNPAKSEVSFDFNFPVQVGSASIKVYNMLGKLIIEQELLEKSGSITLPVSEIPEGVYFYSLILNNKIARTQKLLIQR